jgi:hypothetical protein
MPERLRGLVEHETGVVRVADEGAKIGVDDLDALGRDRPRRSGTLQAGQRPHLATTTGLPQDQRGRMIEPQPLGHHRGPERQHGHPVDADPIASLGHGRDRSHDFGNSGGRKPPAPDRQPLDFRLGTGPSLLHYGQ